jgi:hypothetical protein
MALDPGGLVARVMLDDALMRLERTPVRKLKRTADELRALIKERAAQFGPWPPGMTMLIYPSNDSWDVMISPGKTPDEEDYRVSALWVAVQMQAEFDLRRPYA